MSRTGSGVLFVLPVYPGNAAAIDAASITCADLADALGVYLGGADMLTPAGLRSPDQVRVGAVHGRVGPREASRSAFARLPLGIRVALSDVRDWLRAVSFRRVARSVRGREYRLVVQLHARYHDVGARIARDLRVPFVLRLEAMEIREEAAWGIRRPGWGRLAERRGEFDIIRRAELVAPVSDVLDEQLADEAVPSSRRIVLPNGVDVSVFVPGSSPHDDEERFVVGWVGGFRPFHGLEMIPEIAERLRAAVPRATICLAGAGPERDALIAATARFGSTVRVVDPVAHEAVPALLQGFDACLLLAGAGDFHYSPMKLYEYLACGRPVVAAGVGQVMDIVDDERNGLIVRPADPVAVVAALSRLAEDPTLGARLGEAARKTAVDEASWDGRARTLIGALEGKGLLPAGTIAATPRAGVQG